MKIEFFDRDAAGKLVPIKDKLDTRNELLSEQVDIYKKKISELETKNDSKLNKDIEVYNKVVEMLHEQYEQSGEIIDIEFIPLLKYQISHLQNEKKDTEGMETIDQDASIISTHLIEPKISFEEAKSMKNYLLKQKFVKKIYEYSLPDLDKTKNQLKKVIALLSQLEK